MTDLTKEIEAAAEKYAEERYELMHGASTHGLLRIGFESGANLLKARVERLEEALKFYADRYNWVEINTDVKGYKAQIVMTDMEREDQTDTSFYHAGKRARAALEGKNHE